MMINAKELEYQQLNEIIRQSSEQNIVIENCMGQRYIGAGLSGKNITIHGTPGNALAAYMNGSTICVFGNAQDATADTMNDGVICIHGSAGDATGYAMRGGHILVRDDTGYRAGIHMKEYQDKIPVLMIGRKAGSFLGEYQAGGIIIVFNLDGNDQPPVGYFCGTGMHGGKIFLRCSVPPADLPAQVCWHHATTEDLESVREYVQEFADAFGYDVQQLLTQHYIVLTPNSANPYQQLYTSN